MTSTTYRVEGLRSALEMAMVMENVATITGVSGVEVDLVRQATSKLTVQATSAVSDAQVRDILRRAGLRLRAGGPVQAVDPPPDFAESVPASHRRSGT